MRAVVYRGVGDVRVEDVPVPSCGPGELLVRIGACGVCWTDLKKIDHGLVPPPRVFGHEMAGVVSTVGQGAGSFAVGDRVQVYHHVPCRACALCERRLFAQCEGYKRTGATAGFEPSGGGFAEYVRVLPWIVDGGGVTPVPDGVSLEAASFLEPVNTCLKCVRVADVREGDVALVVGAGAIGLILTRLLVLAGARVVVSEPRSDRRERATESGALRVVDPSSDDVAATVKELAPAGGDVAIVAVPGQSPLDAAFDALRPGGRVVLFAHTRTGDPVAVDAGAVCRLEKSLVGAYSADVTLNDEVADLVFSGRLRVADLVTHRFDLDDATQAFALARAPRGGSVKVVVTTGLGES